MKIAIDAMGGDYAPKEVVLGSVAACRELGAEVILVGDEAAPTEVGREHQRAEPRGGGLRFAGSRHALLQFNVCA